ncbi:Zinc finger CCCH domain-containing protein 30, partial [Mucuna pruriens]
CFLLAWCYCFSVFYLHGATASVFYTLVRTFSSEDCPSKVGEKYQDHLQAKGLSIWPSTTNEYDDDLPPGFESNHFWNQSKAELPHIPQIKWECPPLFTLSDGWRVAVGEESREIYDQQKREIRVLEAIYPRAYSIPPGPSISSEVEKECYDDSLTPLVSFIPIEDQEGSVEYIEPHVKAAVTKHEDSPTNLQQYITSETSLINSQCSEKKKPVAITYSEAEVAAASALVVASMTSNEIDMDLLAEIFNDPVMIEKLIEKHRTVITTVSTPTSNSKPSTSLVQLSSPALNTTVGLLHASESSQETPSVSLLTSTLVKPATAVATSSAKPTKTRPVTRHPPSTGAVKDVDRKVIRKSDTHKEDVQRQEARDVRRSGTHKEDTQRQGLKRPRDNITMEEVKFKIQKPCKYFNSSRGCRNGSNCRFQHDVSGMSRIAKRLNVRSENTWRM